MKKYNVPATEVVAFVGGAIMESASPATQSVTPQNWTDPIPGENT
jgi:hypothetical protein